MKPNHLINQIAIMEHKEREQQRAEQEKIDRKHEKKSVRYLKWEQVSMY